MKSARHVIRFFLELGFFLIKIISKRKWGKFDRENEIASFFNPFRFSWSQSGEDLALLHIFEGKRSGTFIDVGAHHPYRLSVTHHLSRLGWHGVNVDANKDLVSLFDKERKRDINICAAVGTADKYSFTIFKESALSSVNVDWKNNFASQGWEVDRVEEVPGLSLKRIYAENFPMDCIDLLSIDAEGSDYDVLRSIEFDNLEKEKFPKFLLLEATPPVISALNTDSVQYAINFGYVPTLILPMSVLMKRGW